MKGIMVDMRKQVMLWKLAVVGCFGVMVLMAWMMKCQRQSIDELCDHAVARASHGRHLAAATAFCKGFDAEGDDLSVNCKPAALVLFNPVIDNGPGGFAHSWIPDYWQDFSPLHNISTNPPPTIFITGDMDQHTPMETAEKYKARMEEQGGRCELIVHKDGVHGSPFGAEYYSKTLEEMDQFLVSLGYLREK